MQVLRRGNQYCIDGFVIKQSAEILVGFDAGDNRFHGIELSRINVCHGHALNVWAFQRSLEDLRAATTRSDQSNTNAVIGSQHAAGRE